MKRTAEHLAREFFRRVWAPPHDLDAIGELMTQDYRITTAGQVFEGRAALKDWVRSMQMLVRDATNEHLEIITNAADDRVVSRWVTRTTTTCSAWLRINGRSSFPASPSGEWKAVGWLNAG